MTKPLRIIVLGGTGYVGTELVKTLRAAGHQVIVPARSKNTFLAERYGVETIPITEAHRLGQSDALVNLVYPVPTDLHDNFRKVRELFPLVLRLSRQTARVIHISTQAVFGYDLSIPIAAKPVKLRLDNGYVESKILMENLLLASELAAKLRIVRLGNVWGPASPTWTAQLAARLFFQQPVGAVGVDGFSNVTDVANVASYILHLLQSAPESLAGIDHLAEFSGLRWSQFIEPMARRLNVEPVLLPVPPAPEMPGWKELFKAGLRQLSPKTFGIAVLNNRNPAALLRRILDRLPASTLATIREKLLPQIDAAPSFVADDETLLRVLTAQTQFETSVLPGWKPSVNYEQSLQRVFEWMDAAGFRQMKTAVNPGCRN